MSRKDYDLIAAAICRSGMASITAGGGAAIREAKRAALRLVATDLAASLAVDNPRFDQARFLTACGF